MPELKLVALDIEDLEVLSAHLQDAVLKVRDMAYVPSEKRFAAIANRFDWEAAGKTGRRRKASYERRRAALRFERVLGAQVHDIELRSKGAVLELLAIRFEPADPPEGYVTLVFAGGGAVRLHVECVEAELADLGPAWATQSLPRHDEEGADDGDGASGSEGGE